MPQVPLSAPTSLRRRLRGLALALPASVFLLVSLLILNLAQTISLLIRPFSPRTFRAFNRWGANTWWGWCVVGSERINGIRLTITGDEVPPRENAIVIANHQEMADIPFLMIWARRKDRLGDLKWMVKDIIKYVPGVGWGMAFLDCVYVKRSWAADRRSIERTFARLVRSRVPLWLISFPEGTRLTPAKLARSQTRAREHELPLLNHLLLPRTKGFVASVHGLRAQVTAVYDLTLAYPEGVPTLWQYMQGFSRTAHLHVRRFPITEIPAQDEALAEWLLERFQEKDGRLERFYSCGAFVG